MDNTFKTHISLEHIWNIFYIFFFFLIQFISLESFYICLLYWPSHLRIDIGQVWFVRCEWARWLWRCLCGDHWIGKLCDATCLINWKYCVTVDFRIFILTIQNTLYLLLFILYHNQMFWIKFLINITWPLHSFFQFAMGVVLWSIIIMIMYLPKAVRSARSGTSPEHHFQCTSVQSGANQH